MTPQELKAMKLALEALKLLTGAWQTFGALDYGDNAITAIKEVLAEHAMREVQRLGQEIEQKIGCVNHDCDQCKAQPEQEPVAWATKEDFHRELERRLKHIREEMKIKSVTMRCKDYDIALPIIDTDFGRVLVGQVSTPPQRQPLTKEEMFEAIRPLYSSEMSARIAVDYSEDEYRAIEAAHGIKENT